MLSSSRIFLVLCMCVYRIRIQDMNEIFIGLILGCGFSCLFSDIAFYHDISFSLLSSYSCSYSCFQFCAASYPLCCLFCSCFCFSLICDLPFLQLQFFCYLQGSMKYNHQDTPPPDIHRWLVQLSAQLSHLVDIPIEAKWNFDDDNSFRSY